MNRFVVTLFYVRMAIAPLLNRDVTILDRPCRTTMHASETLDTPMPLPPWPAIIIYRDKLRRADPFT